tara:strand:- start:226 stop:453 length:228 start_codon:yes stop_codon:yes gene_type:complete
MTQNNDVDINVLIQIYNQKLSTISNQNVLLEAKIQTLTQDFLEEKTELLKQLKETQDKHDELLADLEEEDGETSK